MPFGAQTGQNERPPWVSPTGTQGEQELVSSLLGGFRVPVADLVWLRLAGAVEERDEAATDTLLALVSALEPRSLYFWINGARILAYDVPGWQKYKLPIQNEGAYRMAQRKAAREAVRRLEQATVYHPHSAALWIERANIELHRLGDVEAAAESYRRAWDQPHAPYYAARLHGELLRRMGRKSAALAWLIALHPRLPENDDAAGADLVLARIRGLERELGVPAPQAYRPLTYFPPHSFLHPC